MSDPKYILVVCTGNTCRSPMGEAWLNHLLKQKGYEDYWVDSCGVYAAIGMGASGGAVRRMEQEGIDLSRHQSKPITEEMIDKAHLIFCMSPEHEHVILQTRPDAAEKIIVLNVSDPIGYSDQVYDECFQNIAAGINEHIGQLIDE